MLGQFGWQHLHKPQIVGAQQAHVKVVVPGDEAIVAHGTEQRAAIEEIGDVILAADAVQLADHLEHTHLHAAQGRPVGVESLAQRLGVEGGRCRHRMIIWP